jgi:hypothetical protein
MIGSFGRKRRIEQKETKERKKGGMGMQTGTRQSVLPADNAD